MSSQLSVANLTQAISKTKMYELFFQHFFQISRNQRMEIQNHQPEKCLVFKKYLKKCYFQTIEVLEIPWVKIATESCVRTPCQNGFPQKVGNQAQECPNHNIWYLRVQENHESKSSHGRNFFAQTFRKPGRESNPGPLNLKLTALPTDPPEQEILGPKIQIYQQVIHQST